MICMNPLVTNIIKNLDIDRLHIDRLQKKTCIAVYCICVPLHFYTTIQISYSLTKNKEYY